MDYLFVDPFARGTSGVSTYCQHASARLMRLGVKSAVLAPHDGEDLEAFRRRLPQVLKQLGHARTIVEAPETLAVTRHLDASVRLHVRLHGSRLFGAWLQHLPQDATAFAAEQREVARATWVSAPSHAAVATHRMHFGGQFTPHVYPNPIEAAPVPLQAAEHDFLFLGRWQPLKGTAFFLALARALPTRRFAVACQERPDGLPASMRFLALQEPSAKWQAIARSAVIVVPSYFETASMVALEAVAMGRAAVIWEHIGAAEYAQAPLLRTARPWRVDDLVAQCETALRNAPKCEHHETVKRLNSSFDAALLAMLAGRTPDPDALRAVSPAIDYRPLFETLPVMNASLRTHVMQRKFRKLLRDPAAFLRDSSLGRAMGRWGPAKPAVVRPEAPQDAGLVAPAEVAVASKRPAHVMGVLHDEGFLKLKPPVKAPSGWSVALVHAQRDTEAVDELIASLDGYAAFKPTQAASLNLIEVSDAVDDRVLNLLSRIDTKTNETLGLVNHLLLVNASAGLVEALRSAAPHLRVILVLTPSAPPDVGVDARRADVLVCLGTHPAAAIEGWRRKVTVSEASQLPFALVRVLRETGPKQPDMLFQLVGEPAFVPDLHHFDATRYQGRMRLSPGELPVADSLREFLAALAPRVTELYVLESVYMRYRSLCNAVEQGAGAAELIEACLADGVLFDVA